MRLDVDLCSIAHNAARVVALAAGASLVVDAVVKDAFTTPPIVDAVARGGIDRLGMSDRGSLARLSPRHSGRHQLLGLAVPKDCRDVFGAFASSLHVCDETLEAMAAAVEGSEDTHAVWLGVRTSDGREGVPPSEVHRCLARWRSSLRGGLHLGGLLANWGCLQATPPDRAELDRLFDVAHETGQRLFGAPLPVSLGGSAILPILDRLPPVADTRLRVGEAIMTGTVPGCGGGSLGLRRPFRLTVEVCDVRQTLSSTELIVNVGSALCDPRDLQPVGRDGTFVWSSSHMSAMLCCDATQAPVPVPGEELSFAMGFNSAVRAMTRRDVAPCYAFAPAERARRLLRTAV